MAIDFPKEKWRQAVSRLTEARVDIASLAVFRILFGLLMAAAMVRFLSKGWVHQLYVEPSFHFSYPGFAWVQPWPGFWMHAHFIALALLAVGVACGFFYRTCITLFFLGFTYVELIDQTAYLNHYYFISLISGLMIFLPANRAWSIDALRKPELRLETVPAWTLNLLRFQVAVVYFFAGLAKVNADWLLHAQPLRIWLPARSDLMLIGPWLNETWVAYAASWFGAIFDLSIVFFLLNKRTRRPAYACVVLFHVATWLLFNIGMFPWIMIVSATLLFAPDWPRAWLTRFAAWASSRLRPVWPGHGVRILAAPEQPPHAFTGPTPEAVRASTCRRPLLRRTLAPGLVGAYVIAQLALPLRSYFSSEPPAWTGAGFNCAWRVMLVEKSGYTEFRAFDPTTGRRWKLSAREYLTRRQEVMMAQDPYLIRAMARRMAADLRECGYPHIQIQADSFATLNGRPSQRLINPEFNLAGAGHAWVPMSF